LHCPPMDGSVLDVGQVREWMSESARKRFDEVWALSFPRDTPTAQKEPDAGRELSTADADLLCNAGIARVVEEDSQTKRWCLPFTVMEERNGELRRRFILWT